MNVIPTQNGNVAVAQAADFNSADETKTASFKAALAQASSTGGTTAGTDVSTPSTTTEDLPKGVKLHKGETAEKVDGHAYYEITSGDREGMFINATGNVRNGQAFVLARKHGKEYHIYGTGKDRLVVGFHMPKKAANDSAPEPKADLSDIKLRNGEKIEPVEGHAYAEIVSGPRSGMYINTSQNGRRGDAFVLVEKADFNYHIYGSGDDRVVIRANKREVDKQD